MKFLEIKMPVSDAWGKGWAKETLLSLVCNRLSGYVVDVGAGYGTYSDLIRNDLVGFHWTAVEVWGPYISVIEDKYDLIINEDIRKFPMYIQGVDVVIFGDVLEHMPKEDAVRLLEAVDPGTIVLVSIPVLHLEQGAVNGNPYEVHNMGWHWTAPEMTATLELLMERGWSKLQYHIGDVLGYFVLS
jgi:hypothetical protein